MVQTRRYLTTALPRYPKPRAQIPRRPVVCRRRSGSYRRSSRSASRTMSWQTNIRRGRATDLAAVLALLESARLPTADIASIDEPQIWVLEERDRIVGVIALERTGSEALLRSLAVTPDYRNRGFGREIVVHVEQSAR